MTPDEYQAWAAGSCGSEQLYFYGTNEGDADRRTGHH